MGKQRLGKDIKNKKDLRTKKIAKIPNFLIKLNVISEMLGAKAIVAFYPIKKNSNQIPFIYANASLKLINKIKSRHTRKIRIQDHEQQYAKSILTKNKEVLNKLLPEAENVTDVVDFNYNNDDDDINSNLPDDDQDEGDESVDEAEGEDN